LLKTFQKTELVWLELGDQLWWALPFKCQSHLPAFINFNSYYWNTNYLISMSKS